MTNECKKILVIDDDPGMVKLLEKRLQSQGFEVVGIVRGREGFLQVKMDRPDLIILDLMIPDMNGRDIVRQLKSDDETKDIPIIFISVTSTKEDPKELKKIKIGAEEYPIFPKPFHNPKLLSVIRRLIREHERRSDDQ